MTENSEKSKLLAKLLEHYRNELRAARINVDCLTYVIGLIQRDIDHDK